LHDLVLPTASILFQNLPKGCSSLNFDLIVVVINCFLKKTEKINKKKKKKKKEGKRGKEENKKYKLEFMKKKGADHVEAIFFFFLHA
jgi:hypothetical protein